MSSSTTNEGWRAAWTRFRDPGWVSDLTLDGTTRSRVRIAAARLAQNDGVDGFPSPFRNDRKDRARRLRVRLAKRWRLFILGAGPISVPVTLMLLLATGVVSSLSWNDVIRIILILPAVQLVVVLLGILAGRDAVTPYWAAALLDEGIAVCPRCGYRPTDDATSTTCPECGLEAWRTVGETVAGREPDTDRTDEESRP